MRRATALTALVLAASPIVLGAQTRGDFSVAQASAFPFASDLAAASTGSRIAWVLLERGVRNIYVAEGPTFTPRKVTNYTTDDGQELTDVSLSHDGRYVVYTRGGDHDSNWGGEGGHEPNPQSLPTEPHIEIYSVAFDGGAPKLLGKGDAPVISPRDNRVAFISGGQIMAAPIDGSAESKTLAYAKGSSSSLVWSPSGDRLAFVSDRGDHSFIGVYSSDDAPITWIAPSTSHDYMPSWSPDGKRVAFVRLRGTGGTPETLLEQHPNPFQLWTADASSGEGRLAYSSPVTLRGSAAETEGEANLHYMTGERLAFVADLDGWPHIYSIGTNGGAAQLLTPGRFMVEYISVSPDNRTLVYSANTGSHANDLDRRHVFSVAVDGGKPIELTPGDGIEYLPRVTGDGKSVAFIGATVQRPMLPAVVDMHGGAMKQLAADVLPSDFPGAKFVTPKAVTFKSTDGLEVHADLFEPPASAGSAAKKPAVIFVHGGPPRQMLLGWHYSFYYSNAYAMNQTLANHGFVVLSLNYRLGIGYGHEFHHPDHAGPAGASEYNDVKAAGLYLRGLPGVDSTRVGIWGGSYGGYLTALALARNSDIFATGVDLHGVHDWVEDSELDLYKRTHYQQPADLQRALDVGWKSSPVSSMATWRSPVLLIQGDDDRNVLFHQTVDLARRLQQRGVEFEEIVLPDEIHDFLRHASWLKADSAMVAWFEKRLAFNSKRQTTNSKNR
ncbi:MAG TPA: prolyl oligopeptidase family serine peptidase [Gemmatimonadaceae bacterium]|jgi:dipeptidyl aminopeptidase/acylaminoacyl peptidase